MSFLTVEKLGKTYAHEGWGVPALQDVEFSLSRGESLAITGPSGAGKSTLLNLLGGLDEPSAGQIVIGGEVIRGFSEERQAAFRQKTLGFVFQFHHLLEDFTILENVMMPLLIQKQDHALSRQRAVEILGRVGLAGLGLRYPQELSGGEQQRSAIARAVVHSPCLILADEPTGNLDEANSGLVFELLCELNHDLSSTLIVVTHQDHFAKKLKRQLKLEAGRVVSFG